MGWGFYGYGGGGSSRKKKATKSYDNWFERLSAFELKCLLQAAQLPVSGTKKKQIERLLGCNLTEMYAAEKPHPWSGKRFHDCGEPLSVSDLQNRCRDAKLKKSGNKFEVIIRLVENSQASKKRAAVDGSLDVDDEPAKKKSKTATTVTTKKRTPMEGEALEKRVAFRLQKLNKQIDDKLKWKPSFKYMNGSINGARVAIECPEPEVFLAMFEQDENMKKSSTGNRLSLSFKTDDAINDTEIRGGKSYQYGAHASIKAPASICLNNGKISFSFKYTVEC